MQLATIVNEIDISQNDQQAQALLDTVLKDITAQVMAVHSAVNDNPRLTRITLEDMTKSIAAAVQAEYLDPGSMLD